MNPRKYFPKRSGLVVLLLVLPFLSFRKPGLPSGGEKTSVRAVLPEANANAGTTGHWPYNNLYRKACHNCYQKQYASSIEDALTHTSNIEIDFYDSRLVATSIGARPGNWYVRHQYFGANDNCSTDTNGKAGDLRDCLTSIRDWSRRHPRHEVLTVFLDKKQAWGQHRQPVDLDNLILDVFPASALYRPADLKAGYPTLRQAARNRAWPTLQALRGKILFVLTGGQTFHHNRTMNEYLQKTEQQAVLFVAADADEASDVEATPQQFGPEQAGQIVFYNIKYGNEAIATGIHRQGYLSRVWNVPEDDRHYRQLISRSVHFIALNAFRMGTFNARMMEGYLSDEPENVSAHKSD